MSGAVKRAVSTPSSTPIVFYFLRLTYAETMYCTVYVFYTHIPKPCIPLYRYHSFELQHTLSPHKLADSF